jgi:hypothetical protein
LQFCQGAPKAHVARVVHAEWVPRFRIRGKRPLHQIKAKPYVTPSAAASTDHQAPAAEPRGIKRRLTGKQPPPAAQSGLRPAHVPYRPKKRIQPVLGAGRPNKLMTKRFTGQLTRKPGTQRTDRDKFECRYCHKFFCTRNHPETCLKRPYDEWLQWVKKKQARTHPIEQQTSWTDTCPHCDMKFPNERGVRGHKQLCRHRRVLASLPVAY